MDGWIPWKLGFYRITKRPMEFGALSYNKSAPFPPPSPPVPLAHHNPSSRQDLLIHQESEEDEAAEAVIVTDSRLIQHRCGLSDGGLRGWRGGVVGRRLLATLGGDSHRVGRGGVSAVIASSRGWRQPEGGVPGVPGGGSVLELSVVLLVVH